MLHDRGSVLLILEGGTQAVEVKIDTKEEQEIALPMQIRNCWSFARIESGTDSDTSCSCVLYETSTGELLLSNTLSSEEGPELSVGGIDNV